MPGGRDKANEATAAQYATNGEVEQLLAKLETLVMRGAVAVCMPAQYLARLEGAPASSVSGFAPACRQACEDDLDEYVARLAAGRPRPEPLQFQPYDQLLVGEHTLRMVRAARSSLDPGCFPKIPNSGDGQQVSLEPLRTWEVNLETRKLTLRTGGTAPCFVSQALT